MTLATAPIGPHLHDALLELVNIGVGRAAEAVSGLCRREVQLTVPTLEVCDLRDSRRLEELQGMILRVSQELSGAMNGHAMLVLNESGAQRLAVLLLGKEGNGEAFDENEQSALIEIGNIVIGGVIGTLADQIGGEVDYTVPLLQVRGTREFVDLFSDLSGSEDTRVMLLHASLGIAAEKISGYVILLFPGGQLNTLAGRLEVSLTRP